MYLPVDVGPPAPLRCRQQAAVLVGADRTDGRTTRLRQVLDPVLRGDRALVVRRVSRSVPALRS